MPKWVDSRLTVVPYVNYLIPGWFFLFVFSFLLGGLKFSLVVKKWGFSSSNSAPLVSSNVVPMGVDRVL